MESSMRILEYFAHKRNVCALNPLLVFNMHYHFPAQNRGTQQAVSVIIPVEDLLWTTIFRLKCDEKLQYFLASIFVIWEK